MLPVPLIRPGFRPSLIARFCLLAACLVSPTMRLTDAAESPNAEVAERMAMAAGEFLLSLSPAERKQVERNFDDPARLDWHNIPKPERKGLQLREMAPAQRELCHALLKTGLSDDGYAKALTIMSLEANLHEGEKDRPNAPLRDPERYFLTIFGKPGRTGHWGWSFEGHHLSLNFTIHDGRVIAVTPSFWGANPATVHILVSGGPEVGRRTLANEEQRAFDLLGSLNEEQRKKALVSAQAPKEYRNAGKPTPPANTAEGLSGNELTQEQQQALAAVLGSYFDHFAKPLADEWKHQFQAQDFSRVSFGWWGATEPGSGHAFRIESPVVQLELVNIQSDPAGNKANHIHSVLRDPRGDFGTAR